MTTQSTTLIAALWGPGPGRTRSIALWAAAGAISVTGPLALVSLITGVLFVIRQRRTKNPLCHLQIAARRTFWVVAVAGIIVFGALMGTLFNSLFGALLATGYAAAVAAAYPQYSTQIMEAAKNAFLAGDQSAYIAGIIAVLVGAALVFFIFP